MGSGKLFHFCQENGVIMGYLRRKSFWGMGLAGAVLASVAVVAVIAAARPRGDADASSERNDTDSANGNAALLAVKTIRPKCDPSFALFVKQPASVVPYYHAELNAQVSGRVEFI